MVVLFLAALLAPQSLDELERAGRQRLTELRKGMPDRGGPQFEAWDVKLFDAQWEYGTTLSRLAEQKKTAPLWKQTVAFWTEFLWEREDYLAALQARIHLARAHQALEEWGPCFANLKAARLTEKPEHRTNPDLVELATRSLIAEFRARAAHGRGVDLALKEAQAHLKTFDPKKETEPFLNLRLEMARALHGLRRVRESEETLVRILDAHEEKDAGESALLMLVDFFHRPPHVRRLADRLFERHHFTAASVHYRSLEKTPALWLRLGICYLQMRRPYEAAHALQQACLAEAPERLEAAIRLDQVLRYLVQTVGDTSIQARRAAHREWMIRTLDLARAGADVIVTQANILISEGRTRDAAELLARVKPDEPRFGEAVHSLGTCRFKEKEYAAALEAFRGYLALEKREPRLTDSALDLAAWSLLQLGKPDEVLTFTEKSLPSDPVYAEWRLAHRVDAFARLGRFAEAQAALGALKEGVSSRATIRALERLATGYEEALARTGDRKLWGPYARAVVALSEKTFRPLQGEKLLHAADALLLEGTSESAALAFELYGQYLAGAALRDTDRAAVDYRRAQAAVACGRLARAAEIAGELQRHAPYNGTYQELQGDVASARAAAEPRGPRRIEFLDEALRIYGDLSASRAVGSRDEHYYRLTWKYAERLLQRDPDRARAFFHLMEKKGYGGWDEDRWGYASRMKKLRDAAR